MMRVAYFPKNSNSITSGLQEQQLLQLPIYKNYNFYIFRR